jgi:hypothetical protein
VASSLSKCPCGVRSTSRLCAFCRRTVALFQADRCVTCTIPMIRDEDARIEGRCAECRSRNVRYSTSTRWLMHLAVNAISQQKARDARRPARAA